MSLAERQRLLAEVLTDSRVEIRVREQPEEVARERGLDPAFVLELAALGPSRIRSFRRSRRVKAERRGPGGRTTSKPPDD